MEFMVAFDSWIFYQDLHIVNFFFLLEFYSPENNSSVKLFFSFTELWFLRSNINVLTNLSEGQADFQFQIPNPE